MRERSCSEVSDEEILYHKDKKKIKICGNPPSEEPLQEVLQDDFEALWEKLVLQLRRILQLKVVEAIQIAENVHNLSVQGCNRPRLLQETDKLLNDFCLQLYQSLCVLENPRALLRDYHRAWCGYQLALEDLNTVIRVFHIQGIVKRGLTAWALRVFVPLKPRLDSFLGEFSSNDMEVCTNKAQIDRGCVKTQVEEGGDVAEDVQCSIFASYHKEFSELFLFAVSLRSIFPDDEVEGDDEDEFLYKDILGMKFPTVNINPSKEEGIDGFVNTALLPSELVFEIFTFLSSEKELITAGQVCRRWYMLTKQKSLWQGLKERKALGKDLIRIYSKEGHEFILGLTEASRSTTLSSILQMHTAVEAKTHTMRFTTICTKVLEKIVQYFYYKVMYTNSTGAIPDFPIEPDIALEILMASNFLDC